MAWLTSYRQRSWLLSLLSMRSTTFPLAPWSDSRSLAVNRSFRELVNGGREGRERRRWWWGWSDNDGGGGVLKKIRKISSSWDIFVRYFVNIQYSFNVWTTTICRSDLISRAIIFRLLFAPLLFERMATGAQIIIFPDSSHIYPWTLKCQTLFHFECFP